MDVPSYVSAMDDRPGKEWSEAEHAKVIDWWCERSQLKLVWYSAARYLGSGATAQDVEDAVSQFYIQFDGVRRSYRPDAGLTFSKYLLNVCFKNYCVAHGKKIQTRRNVEVSLEQQGEDGSQLSLEIEDIRVHGNPERQVQSQAFRAELSRLLRGPLLSERQKQVFTLRYLDDLTYEEIAATMNVPVGSVKGWLSRATHTVRACLVGSGWSQGPVDR